MITKLMALTGRYIHREWEVQVVDHQNCFRTWSSGLNKKDAIREMRECQAKSPKIWRVECRIVCTNYIMGAKEV